ncbi:MAG: DUF4856 domain-containing protein [Bacteroidota bacterium]
MIKNINLFKSLTLGLVVSIAVASCKKDKDEPVPTPVPTGYTVPVTYNFANVNYGGQSTRLTMMDSISNYMKKGNNGIVLDANLMKDMYSNTGNPFGLIALDASGKQLKNKTYSLDQTYFDALFDSLAVASQSAVVASNGVAGLDGGRLFDRNGIELAQVIKKQLMGAVFYYQAVETYLANFNVDDNTTLNSDGTTMEHHCDEAFGYFGAPIDFPTNISEVKYWAEYCAEVNTPISCNTALMNGFLKLRAAISNKDYTTRDAQVIIVREQWERVVAASAILEMKEAKAAFGTDQVEMRHVLSEAVGFINSLKYNSNKKISNTQIATALSALGNNFYTISVADIDTAINAINTVYAFNLSAF